ncbi:hypothetical protein AINA4_14790 [Aurantimicrobium sp. INA4]|uniref:DUF6671 family protein n=1 Tax=Aurantimicrobium sp. INA4 TaxID=2986279 RepID=UPI0024902199|nr:DUF6671 family protein [Aurantimicrobium sp. INA4]BDU11558.1 hypothetical protein AINA4_14790 [Aurantimicrobium sp. INA4]
MSKRIALATKHGKLAKIAPAFEAVPEWELTLAEIDTDEFGTFSGEIPRTLSPRDAAIAKARAGAKLLGTDYGLASEGSIGSHPQLPWVTSDHELLALVCVSKDFVIVESHLSADIRAYKEEVNDNTDLEELATRLDLPEHAANILYYLDTELIVLKGIHDPEKFIAELNTLREASVQNLRVESDFRAMSSPSRQRNISACAEKLVTRISTRCVGCNEIGWGKVGYEYGLPCSGCGQMVASVPHSEKFGCVACDYSEVVSLGQHSIDPARCDFCNP